jgi:hypothetical protein
MSNFKEKYLLEEISISEIDDFIEAWHKKPIGTLREYLGLTPEEYLAYSHGESKLKQILDKQKQNRVASILKALAKVTR